MANKLSVLLTGIVAICYLAIAVLDTLIFETNLKFALTSFGIATVDAIAFLWAINKTV